MRKLASIQKIVSIKPIPGADRIECATVLGWECVIRKDEFKVGDLVVYVEVDSIMPVRPEFEFLRERKFRVRTIKLKKQISQGLCLPLPVGKFKEGDDVTELLGVTKYDPEALEESLRTNNISRNRVDKFLKRYKWYRRFFTKAGKKGWPEFIKKTDEDRIQLFPWICEKEKCTTFIATEKLDGQSATYSLLKLPKKWWQFKQQYQFFVCSRNINLKTEHPCSYWDIANKYNIKKVLMDLISSNEYITLQGEIVGEGIQKNKYGIIGKDFYAFNLIFPTGRIGYVAMIDMLRNSKLKVVPIVDMQFSLGDNIKECVELSKGKSVIANIHREGLVVRNYNKNISFKIINPDFLLKYQDEA